MTAATAVQAYPQNCKDPAVPTHWFDRICRDPTGAEQHAGHSMAASRAHGSAVTLQHSCRAHYGRLGCEGSLRAHCMCAAVSKPWRVGLMLACPGAPTLLSPTTVGFKFKPLALGLLRHACLGYGHRRCAARSHVFVAAGLKDPRIVNRRNNLPSGMMWDVVPVSAAPRPRRAWSPMTDACPLRSRATNNLDA